MADQSTDNFSSDTSSSKSQVSASERRWVLGFAVIVGLITTLPYLLGFAVEGNNYYFTGFVFAVEEGNSYIAKMLTGTFGAWLFHSPYTAYPQQGMLVYLPYILLGKLASPPGLHEQLVALFQLFRLAACILVILATYDFLSFFLQDLRARRLGLVLTIFGGGLGWLLVLLGENAWLDSLPLDFYSPETFGFLGIYGLPHLALARALILWTLIAYLRLSIEDMSQTSNEKPSFPSLFSIFRFCGLWLLAGLMQPLSMLIIGVIIFWHLFGLATWKVLNRARGGDVGFAGWWIVVRVVFFAGILPAAFVLYNLFMSYSDSYVSTWMAQNVVLSPHPAHYLVAYGLILPYAVWGGRIALRKDPIRNWLLVGWIIIAPLLAYLPINLQRRLLDGIWVAFMVLVMIAYEEWVSQEAKRRARKRWVWFAPYSLLFITSAFLLAGGLLVSSRVAPPLFRLADEVAVFIWIQTEAEPQSVVLAAYETGNPLPAWAPVRVLIGHGPESSHLVELQPQVKDFYSTTTPDQARIDLFHEFNVDYVFFGPAERALGDWEPSRVQYLRVIYQAGDYQLYQFVP